MHIISRFFLYSIGKLFSDLKTVVEIINLTLSQVQSEREELALTEEYINAPFKCTGCVKWFKYEDSYDAHLKSHTEVFPFTAKFHETRIYGKQKMNFNFRGH